MDRRKVILLNTSGTMVISLLIVLLLNDTHEIWFSLLSFLFRTPGLTVYSVCIATANDYLTKDQIIPASSSPILILP